MRVFIIESRRSHIIYGVDARHRQISQGYSIHQLNRCRVYATLILEEIQIRTDEYIAKCVIDYSLLSVISPDIRILFFTQASRY